MPAAAEPLPAMETADLLPELPSVPDRHRIRLESEFERFRGGLPPDLRGHCLDAYGVDLQGEYAGRSIAVPFGKASGQLSLNARQVRRDAEGGLGFVVLKTVIAEDPAGRRTMGDWALAETHMRVERIRSAAGEEGWTVTWKGRGWHESFERYCAFFAEAAALGQERGMPVAASVKYHLPPPGQAEFCLAEYEHTTRRLRDVWRRAGEGPLPLEKDFSPTLAGDDRSREQEQILLWLREVPGLVYAAEAEVCLGVKLMNARFDMAFQVEMCRVLVEETPRPPEFLVYANRLFDPDREFEGRRGVAYGGPELSHRNLAGLRGLRAAAPGFRRPLPPLSGTGDILSGRTALRYGLAGCSSCQVHTLFQLPDTEFAATTRNKTEAVLHHLVLHPRSGLVAWLLHLGQRVGRGVHWRDLPALGKVWPIAAGA